MNFLSMKYFSSVAKEMSFTKAAEKLHITQQTLSAHIASIEKELGRRLLVRTTPLQLTYEGEVFLRYARQFEKLYVSMSQEFADIRAEEKGILRVGIAHTRGRAILPELIEQYHKQYPQIEVQLIEGTNDYLQQRLIDGEADLLIANFPDGMPGIQLRPFYEEELVLLISERLLTDIYGEQVREVVRRIQEDRDLSPLSECPFLIGNQEDIGARIGNRIIAEALITPRITAQSTNIETLLELCLRGAGACFCADILVQRTLTPEQLSTVRILRFGKDLRYQIKFGWMKRSYSWSAIQNFVEIGSKLMMGN